MDISNNLFTSLISVTEKVSVMAIVFILWCISPVVGTPLSRLLVSLSTLQPITVNFFVDHFYMPMFDKVFSVQKS